ncbi:MAG TPA: hypothetical protein VF711_02680 [Acidimicrobiales bacterium]|jgi:probable HAF family extracellular repeat protein
MAPHAPSRLSRGRAKGLAAAIVVALSSLGVVGTSPANAGTNTGLKFQVLANLPGGTASYPQAVNNGGQTVGIGEFPRVGDTFTSHATLWSPHRRPLDLGTWPGGTYSTAEEINDVGTIVGFAQSAYGWNGGHAVVWDAATHAMSELTPLVPPSSCGDGCTQPGTPASASGINSTGQISGMSQYSDGRPRAVVWDTTTSAPTDIGGLQGGYDFNQANAINDSGQVAGASNGSFDCGNEHAFVWSSTTGAVDIDNCDSGGNSVALSINSAGQLVGFMYNFTDYCQRPFFWDPGTQRMTDIGSPRCGNGGSANDINNKGQVVGNMDGHAFLWTSTQVTNLDKFMPTGWTSNNATSINDKGQITGVATDIDFVQHGFLLTLPRAYR